MDAPSALSGSGRGAHAAENEAAASARKKKVMVAVTRQGKRWMVRVSVNGQEVGTGAIDGNIHGGPAGELEGGCGDGLQTSLSGSSKTSTSYSLDQEKAVKRETTGESNKSKNDSDLDCEDKGGRVGVPTGEAGVIVEGARMSTADSSSSADIPATPGAAAPGTAAGTEGGSNFEASLLLGIANESTSNTTASGGGVSGVATPQTEPATAGSGKERREPVDPATLPTSMTSFLDMLTEDQRRVRHRHIPGVEGFRKLYRNEVKADMSEARRMKRAKYLSRKSGLVRSGESIEADGEEKGEKMMVDENNDDVTVQDQDAEQQEEEEENEDDILERNTFVVPCSDAIACAKGGQLASMIESSDFENAICGVGSDTSTALSGPNNYASPHSLRSPRLVDSLTSFDPPRPQESTGRKTKHRLRRWEANPAEVEIDLANYCRTVSRTREELHAAHRERERIDSLAGLVRDHFVGHLMGYRSEVLATNEQFQAIQANCLRLEEEYGGRSISTRGCGRGMKEALGALKALGEEMKCMSGNGAIEVPKDWRVIGVGGVSATKSGMEGGDGKSGLASGWILVGDDVIIGSSGEEGEVVYVSSPGFKNSDKAGMENSNEAMDVGTHNVGFPKQEGNPSFIINYCTKIGVKLVGNGQVKEFKPVELKFNTNKLPSLGFHHFDPLLARRWWDMAATAPANGAVDHDVAGMGEYIHSALLKERAAKEDDVGKNKEMGEGSNNNDDIDGAGGGLLPTSVAQYDDGLHRLLPFSAGLFAAPKVVRDYPSVIPLDDLEGVVRGAVCEMGGPRVIPTVSSSVKKYEVQREEANALRGKTMQLRNRLSRQMRLRGLNERSLVARKIRAHKVEGLLLEMQMDLRNLKERLQDELNELGIGNSPLQPNMPENDEDDSSEIYSQEANGTAPKEESDARSPASDTVKDDVFGEEVASAKDWQHTETKEGVYKTGGSSNGDGSGSGNNSLLPVSKAIDLPPGSNDTEESNLSEPEDECPCVKE